MLSDPLSDLLDALREPGTSDLSATRIAELFGLQLQYLATIASVHHGTVQTHPESPKLQDTLRDLVRVLSAAALVQPNREQAISLIGNVPIPAFRDKTVLQMVAEGRVEDAIDYLESIRSGAVG